MTHRADRTCDGMSRATAAAAVTATRLIISTTRRVTIICATKRTVLFTFDFFFTLNLDRIIVVATSVKLQDLIVRIYWLISVRDVYVERGSLKVQHCEE